MRTLVMRSRTRFISLRGGAPKPAVAPAPADGPDVVVAFVHFRQQACDLLGRVLQIRVEGDDARAAGVRQPRHDGHVLAEVAVEQDHPRDVGAALELFAQQRR